MKRFFLILILLVCASFTFSQSYQFEIPQWQGMKWYKGNTHAHTTNSDGNAGPYEVAKWYKDHGYDFLSITDHNQTTDPTTIKNIADSTFLLVPGNEISSSNKNVENDTQGRAIHLNGLNVNGDVPVKFSSTVVGSLQDNVDAIRAAGGIVHLNHPNFHWSFGAKEMLQLKNVSLFEVSNMHPGVDNQGGGGMPSTEEMWDEMLTAGKRIFGIATDDTHDYRSFLPTRANPGRGWIVVKANKLEADEIVKNMEKGFCYASTGVDLKDIVISSDKIEIQIKQRGKAKYKTEFIGDGGKVLATSLENPAVFKLDQKATYVRANVHSSNNFTAWIQPVFVKQK